MMRRWIERVRRSRDLVARDTDRLIAQFGEQAYEEARARIHADRERRVIDADRAHGHWDKVRAEIKRKGGMSPAPDPIGLSSRQKIARG